MASYSPSASTEASIDNVVASFRLGQWFSPLRYSWLSLHGINTEYDSKKFHSLRMRLRFPASTITTTSQPRRRNQTVSALIFRNGKVVLCGAHSERTVHQAVQRVRRRVQFALDRGAVETRYIHHHRFPRCRIQLFRIHNMVGSMTLNFRVDMQRIHEEIALLGRHGDLFSRSLFCLSQFPAVRLKYRTRQLQRAAAAGPEKKKKSNDEVEEGGVERHLSVSIFSSGKVIIAGALTGEQINQCAASLEIFISAFAIKWSAQTTLCTSLFVIENFQFARQLVQFFGFCTKIGGWKYFYVKWACIK